MGYEPPSTVPRSGLAAPCEDRTGLHVLYDSHCRFCRWTLARLLRRDARWAVIAVPIDSIRGDELLAELAPADRSASVHVIDRDGLRHSAGAAVRVLLEELAPTSAAGGLARRFPGAIDTGYRLVARHRGRLSRLLTDAALARADALVSARVDRIRERR